MKFWKKIVTLGVTATMLTSLVACGGKDTQQTNGGGSSKDLPTIDAINLGEDYKDIKTTIKVLINRTDLVDTTYKGYAEEFNKLYPNIKVDFDAIQDYEQALTLRMTNGDWGDICLIPNSINKDELSSHFISYGEYSKLNKIYKFCTDKSYDGQQYGIANGGNANGILYNEKVWNEAGIKELPKTPDEFLKCLQQIKDKTDAIPLYTNFGAGWTMGAWDQYIGINATGDADYMNNTICHTKNPFAKQKDMTGPYAVYYTLYNAVSQKLIEEDPTSTDWDSSKTKINNGEIATMVLGSWAIEQCKSAGDNPDDVKYMPFPITVDGKQYVNTGGDYNYGINKDSSKDNQIASMVFVKWITEKSTIFEDQGTIPVLQTAELPEALSSLETAEMLTNNPAADGEETLFNDINTDSEVGINQNDEPDRLILEAALKNDKSLDDIMAEWNQKWTDAQESAGVEITK